MQITNLLIYNIIVNFLLNSTFIIHNSTLYFFICQYRIISFYQFFSYFSRIFRQNQRDDVGGQSFHCPPTLSHLFVFTDFTTDQEEYYLLPYEKLYGFEIVSL